MEANYFIEVCKEVLGEPRFSDEDLESFIFFRSAAKRFLEHEVNKAFSNKLEHLLEELFTTTLNLSRLWAAFGEFAVGDALKLEFKRYCDKVGVEMNLLFYHYITEEIFF